MFLRDDIMIKKSLIIIMAIMMVSYDGDDDVITENEHLYISIKIIKIKLKLTIF
jgi:hypothetical protein